MGNGSVEFLKINKKVFLKRQLQLKKNSESSENLV